MKTQVNLGKDSVFSLVLHLAIPTMIANFVNVLYNIVDRMFIGNIPQVGGLALAGAGVCGPIVTLLTSFGSLIGLGGSILFSMRLGEERKKEAETILSNSFLMLAAVSAVLTLLFLILKNKLLMWFGASAVTFPYANTYMTIYTLGTFFALMAVGLNYFITCQGFASISMVTVLIGAVSNIILDPVFIFVFRMGVAGAAVATVLSQMFSCLFALFFLFGRKVPVRITFGNYSSSLMRRIIHLGISPFLIMATDSIIMIVLNSSLQRYGGLAEGDLLITAGTIIQSYMLIITSTMLGISSGTQAILSYNYGAKQADRIKLAEKYILMLCLIFTSVMFLISRLLPAYFARIFTNDPSQIRMAVWGIHVCTLSIIPLSFQYAFVDGLTALGCTRAALTLSMFRKGSYVILVLALPAFLGARNAFYAEPLCDILGSAAATISFFLIFQKHLDRRMHEVPPPLRDDSPMKTV
ncbi:MATE family efflux transporter [Lacrimispora sp. NSJ-141]|uniref:Multidrug export protein MepA n=1 Tax=Lientehia hominis TaxID=2897778 RepID=A0AAP2W7T9_9FIRM|nr:MATE family efflux transporter [Lientehia hominis]MCD2491395.1 MATE family efflux transporter [Lientehia hominis]